MTFGKGLLILASVAAIALLVRSLLIEPVPLWIATVAIAGYLAIAMLGVLFPSLNMYANVLCAGPRDLPVVAITFDGGPHPVHTRKVLKILDRAGVKATFFVLGKKAEAYPNAVREILSRGHTIGIGGYEFHRRLGFMTTKSIAADLDRAARLIEDIAGHRPTLFRCVGWVSPRLSDAAAKLDLTIVGASVEGNELGKMPNPQTIVARVCRGLKPGAIVRLHDSDLGDDEPPAVEALPTILDYAYSQGLGCVDVLKFANDSVARPVSNPETT